MGCWPSRCTVWVAACPGTSPVCAPTCVRTGVVRTTGGGGGKRSCAARQNGALRRWAAIVFGILGYVSAERLSPDPQAATFTTERVVTLVRKASGNVSGPDARASVPPPETMTVFETGRPRRDCYSATRRPHCCHSGAGKDRRENDDPARPRGTTGCYASPNRHGCANRDLGTLDDGDDAGLHRNGHARSHASDANREATITEEVTVTEAVTVTDEVTVTEAVTVTETVKKP